MVEESFLIVEDTVCVSFNHLYSATFTDSILYFPTKNINTDIYIKQGLQYFQFPVNNDTICVSVMCLCCFIVHQTHWIEQET